MSTRSELNKQSVHLCVDRFETVDAVVLPPFGLRRGRRLLACERSPNRPPTHLEMELENPLHPKRRIRLRVDRFGYGRRGGRPSILKST